MIVCTYCDEMAIVELDAEPMCLTHYAEAIEACRTVINVVTAKLGSIRLVDTIHAQGGRL